MNEQSDDWILSGLRSPDKGKRNQALKAVYSQFYQSMTDFVCKNSGSEAEAADVFQDVIIVFYTNAQEEGFSLNCSIKTYLYSICRNLWFNTLRRKNKVTPTDELPEIPEEDFVQVLLKTERQQLIAKAIERMGVGCKKILGFYYFDRFRMKKIAELMGLANEQVARNKKADCLRKLRKLMKETPGLEKNLR
ncbi:MAG: sigma-70 family RNA polymerase sigma factor [Bacteroidota bacterium]